MLGVYLFLYALRYSNSGLAMSAVHGDEETAAGIGVPVYRTKLLALSVSGLDEFVFKYFFETGHKLFFGLLLAVVIVWAPKGLFGKSIRKE
jgi:ABC-type branched-subunit amino acid transport system permease subunit